MSEPLKVSDKIAEKIASLDEQIAQAKSETMRASQLVAQLQMMAGKKKVKELLTLKSALEEIQKEALKEEVTV